MSRLLRFGYNEFTRFRSYGNVPSFSTSNKFGKSSWGTANTRRSRIQGNGQPDNNEVVDRRRSVSIKDFEECVESFFGRIELGLLPMKEVNEDFDVQQSTIDAGERSIVVNLGSAGDYNILTIQTANDRRVLDYFSPASGKLVYAYCDETNTFRSIDDDHDLLGILARDLIKDAKGFPAF